MSTHRPAFHTTTRPEPTPRHKAAEPERNAPFPDGLPPGRRTTRSSANERSRTRGLEHGLAPCHHGDEAFDTPCAIRIRCVIPSHAATKRCRLVPQAPLRPNHRKRTACSFRRRCRNHPRPEGLEGSQRALGVASSVARRNPCLRQPERISNEGNVHRQPADVATGRDTGTPQGEQTVPKTRSSVTTTPTLTFHSRSPNVPDVAQ